jgi:DNA polymerase
MGPGGRIRYSYKMNGAVRTGRWSAGGSQLHNFARGDKGLKKEREAIIAAISHMDIGAIEKISGGRPMLAMATVLRNALIADPCHTLVAMDYAAIEARLVMWEAGARGLKVFSDFDAGLGPEPYRVYAGMIFGVDPKDVTSAQRAVGKETVLGSGFGMSPRKFMERLQGYGIPCDMALAERCIKGTYRAQNPEVCDWNTGAWRKLGDAALHAIRCRGSVVESQLAVPVKLLFDGTTLFIKLPSGRKLCYWKAGIDMQGRYGEEITYWTHGSEGGKQLGWHQTQSHGAKLYENITQAISADLTRDAMLKISQRYSIRLHSHDEIVCSVPDGEIEEAKAFMKQCMCNGPEWAKGLPIAVAGWVDKRFIKD